MGATAEINDDEVAISPPRTIPNSTANIGCDAASCSSASTIVDGGGWKSIDVFVGEMKIPEQEDGNAILSSWKSQARQETLVAGLLHEQRDGYFIDLAANHYMDMSNTYPLERQYGWNGLCLEANPKYWSNLTYYRDCKVVGAIVGKNRMEQVTFNFELWGGVGGGIVGPEFDNKEAPKTATAVQMYTVPLEEVFRRNHVPSVIDYMSLDVEGAEHFIMQSFPYQHHRIRVMTVERPKPLFYRIVEAQGYVCLATISDFGETLWVHNSTVQELDLDSVRRNAVRLSQCTGSSGRTSNSLLLGMK